VLSACQTGASSVTPGGEILGLARALIYAGMPNLILSLWEVADKTTAQIMLEFHQQLLSESNGHLEISRSLQKAQIKAISQGLSVQAWAPFIHIGID
jgi:CHAT domain-containing protein